MSDDELELTLEQAEKLKFIVLDIEKERDTAIKEHPHKLYEITGVYKTITEKVYMRLLHPDKHNSTIDKELEMLLDPKGIFEKLIKAILK